MFGKKASPPNTNSNPPTQTLAPTEERADQSDILADTNNGDARYQEAKAPLMDLEDFIDDPSGSVSSSSAALRKRRLRADGCQTFHETHASHINRPQSENLRRSQMNRLPNRHTMSHYPPEDLSVSSDGEDEGKYAYLDPDESLEEGDLVLTGDMSLRDRQNAINQSHPFGIRLWKPALYKKTRTIENLSYLALHETPLQATGSSFTDWHLYAGNLTYFFFIGWWMSIIYAGLAVLILVTSLGTSRGRTYAGLTLELATYMWWPFGKYLERIHLLSDYVSTSPTSGTL